MSKTFSSRPVVSQQRGRGASRPGVSSVTRGASSQGRVAGRSQSQTHSPSRYNSSSNTSSVRGGVRGKPPGANMDYPGAPRQGLGRGARYNPDGTMGAEGDERARESEGAQAGQFTGAYTMFTPDERRRQKVAEMARKEEVAYEQYKKQTAQKSFSYVGTTGGGEINEDQARLRQANAVRAQKFNRLTRQEEQRQAKKRAEDQEIEARKQEARRKAEQNAQRDKAVSAEEIRRKREAFLSQIEKGKTVNETIPPSSSSPPSNTTRQKVQSPSQRKTSTSRTNNPRPIDSYSQTTSHKSSSNSGLRQSSVTTSQKPNDSRKTERSSGTQHPSAVTTSQKSRDVRQSERTLETYATQHPNTSSSANSDFQTTAHETDDLTFLTGMYPDLDSGYLLDLLFQMGSVDGVLELLGAAD